MQLISGDEAERLWNELGLLERFRQAEQQILFCSREDGSDLRIFYGQKGYPEAKANSVIVIVCETKAEWERWMAELKRRGGGFFAVADGQHRTGSRL
jgi:hypothetical protein